MYPRYVYEIYDWVQTVALSIVIVVLAFTFVARQVRVDGHSMLQTLQHNDRLMVINTMLVGEYKRGDIVVLRKESLTEDLIVKRIIALGGETIDIDFSTGGVYIDGELLEEDYINNATINAAGTQFPLTVPEGSVFVMGDNRQGSSDSRDSRLGTVDERYLVGRAVLLLIPGEDYYTEEREWSRIGIL
ncbi:MAG: signal peptidase I [Oscillospiraceae bacterium]|nr:signal peptidase I [Oscillospiraceae bacterium]